MIAKLDKIDEFKDAVKLLKEMRDFSKWSDRIFPDAADAAEFRRLSRLVENGDELKAADAAKLRELERRIANFNAPRGGVYRGTLASGNDHFFGAVTKENVRLFPQMPGRRMGHPHINVRDPKVLDVLNNPERVFTGRNKWGNNVDVYYKDGSVVVTDAGRKTDVITAYGRIEGVIKVKGRRVPARAVNPDQWFDPFYRRPDSTGTMQIVGWDQAIGERYAEILLTAPNTRINHRLFPLYEYTNP